MNIIVNIDCVYVMCFFLFFVVVIKGKRKKYWQIMVCGVLCFYGYKVILGGNCENFIFNNGIFFFCYSF